MVIPDSFVQFRSEIDLFTRLDEISLLVGVCSQIEKPPGFTRRFFILFEPPAVGVCQRADANGATAENARIAFYKSLVMIVSVGNSRSFEDRSQGRSRHMGWFFYTNERENCRGQVYKSRDSIGYYGWLDSSRLRVNQRHADRFFVQAVLVE